jgi:hypothetical protein
MINVCSHCGIYRADKAVDLVGSIVICPECGHPHPFQFTTLFLVGGASGTGKSAVIGPLLQRQPPVVVLEADILWHPEFDKPDEQYRDFFETWLRLAKNIAQNGSPVSLLGSGFVVPENITACVESRYFSQIHRLALTCDDDLLTERLQSRPAWRGSGGQTFVDRQVAFNQWCRQQGTDSTSGICTLDTSHASVNETAEQIMAWLSEQISATDGQ